MNNGKRSRSIVEKIADNKEITKNKASKLSKIELIDNLSDVYIETRDFIDVYKRSKNHKSINQLTKIGVDWVKSNLETFNKLVPLQHLEFNKVYDDMIELLTVNTTIDYLFNQYQQKKEYKTLKSIVSDEQKKMENGLENESVYRTFSSKLVTSGLINYTNNKGNYIAFKEYDQILRKLVRMSYKYKSTLDKWIYKKYSPKNSPLTVKEFVDIKNNIYMFLESKISNQKSFASKTIESQIAYYICDRHWRFSCMDSLIENSVFANLKVGQ